MDIYICENIRRLRRERGDVQERLAEHLGVSAQAVSKWERGEACPDVALIPAIAEYFGVTTDELFGMDRMYNSLYNVYKRASELTRDGDFAETIELYEQTLKRFPSDNSSMSGLAQVLAIYSNEADDITRAVKLSELALSRTTKEKLRSSIRAGLCYIYAKSGDWENALEAAKTLPHFWESRELNLPEFLQEPERSEYIRERIPVFLEIICKRIDGVSSVQENLQTIILSPPVEKTVAEMLEKISEFYGQ